MSVLKLREGLWSVGVLNPSQRVFDIVVGSQYGTSYNAYLIKGKEKTALIETVHKDYFDQFVHNIEEILPLDQVDYLIMNHTEPDHSGSVRALLDRCPNLTVLCSNPAKKFLTSIANTDFPCRVIKDGDSLDLGGKTLQFISAPLLHWPDTIFTWDETDKVLFTCDFLGCHFCEPSMLYCDIHSEYRAAYEAEFKNYFDCILGPFKPAVLDGLAKMPAQTELVCNSHGPCLSGETISRAKELYRQWATPQPHPDGKKTAAILYSSAYGYTRALAERAAAALTADGLDVQTADLVLTNPQVVARLANTCDVVLLGAPTINRDAPAPVWNAVHAVDAINTRGRAAGAFGSFGWSGEAPGMVQGQLKQLKFKTPDAPFKVCFTPTEADLVAVASWARSVAALAADPAPVAPKAQKYICKLCGYIYDPAEGDPDHGVAPGTTFEDIPKLWTCPLCGMDKAMFKPLD